MTKDKAEKAAVRARMAKTGERYTTARHYLLDHHRSPDSPEEDPVPDVAREMTDAPGAPLPPRVAQPGVSEAALVRATGKTWNEWFGLIDAWDGTAKAHVEIARHLHEAHGVDDWWAQGVTVGYERARGMLAWNEKPDGFSVSASKTIAAPVEHVFAAFGDEVIRNGWLEEGALRTRTARPPRSARFDVLLPGGDGTRLEVFLTAKGAAKASVSLQHVKLSDQDAVEPWRAFWKDRLNRLAVLLTTG